MFGDLFEGDNEGGSLTGSGPGPATGLDIPLAPRLASGLCGIYNQGATCYLNSLLQTLLMTSEFREALFNLGCGELGFLEDKDKPEAKVRVIPIQLQRLFARLLLLNAQGAYTTELTDSFGWTNSEELQQHDVQELNRILFSAIEDSLVGTSGGSLIQDLYHGSIVNQIICQRCGRVSEREEDFLDLCIAVAGNTGLEQGLRNCYVEEEMLAGKNQYRCEVCNRLVDARKGAKLRRLPPIVTISLLRFSFDFHKMERYKETGKFTFPQILDMSPYCENLTMAGNTEYELFSVVIHKGSTHGGHYHAYIRDLDSLGKWTHPDEEEIQLPTDPATGKIDFIEFDSPIELLQVVLQRNGMAGMPVDKLCSELVKQTGVSWNKRFKRQYGAISKFVRKYDDKFVFNPASNWVSLRDYSGEITGEVSSSKSQTGDGQGDNAACQKKKQRPLTPPPEPGQCWFDFNDSRVQPIRTAELEKQFSGKESAYMLSYRRRGCHTSTGFTDQSYGVPARLLEEIALENAKLSSQREAYETKVNEIHLHVHFAAFYECQAGALRPLDDSLSYLDLTIDRRKTVEELKIAVYELGGDLVPTDCVLHLARERPAGLHVYDCVSEDCCASVMSTSIGNNSRVFVWDGEQVKGTPVATGEQHEPLLLTVAYGSTARLTQAYPKSLTAGELRCMICDMMNAYIDAVKLSKVVTKGEESVVIAVSSGDDGKSLAELKLSDGDLILAENTANSAAAGSELVEVVLAGHTRLVSFVVENRLSECVEEVWPVMPVEVEKDSTVELLKTVILSRCGVTDLDCQCRLRVDDENFGLRSPLHEQQNVSEAGLKQGMRLVLEAGQAPLTNEITLRFTVAPLISDKPHRELIVNSNSTVQACLDSIIKDAQLSGDDWHLRRTNWCGEAAALLDDLEETLEGCNVRDGDHVLVEKGTLPPKGFLKFAVWLLPCPTNPNGQNNPGMLDWITSNIQGLMGESALTAETSKADEPLCVGDIILSKLSTLEDLKLLILTLPVIAQAPVPTTDFMRVRLLGENQRPTLVLRGPSQTLQRLKMTSGSQLGVQVLQQEEDLNDNQILLHVQLRVAGTRSYLPAQDLVWELAHGANAQSLRQAVAASVQIPQDKLVIAKHFHSKFEWMIIKETQKSGKNRRKPQKKSNIKHSPYFISDGDVIGVKDTRFEQGNSGDFSTEYDDTGKELQRIEIDEKQRKREESKRRNAEVGAGGDSAKNRRPEVGIKIHVADFR